MFCSTTTRSSLRSSERTCTSNPLPPAPFPLYCSSRGILSSSEAAPSWFHVLWLSKKCESARYYSYSSKKTHKKNTKPNDVSSGDQVGCWWRDLVALSPHSNDSVMLSCGDASSEPYLRQPLIITSSGADELSVAGVRRWVVPPRSGPKRTPSSDSRPLFFSSSPPRESVLPSNEIFRCAVCWSVWPWPTVASLDVYLLHWCHCLCWGVWLWRNHPKALVKCICRIKQNFRMPENAFAWCFIIVDGGNKSIYRRSHKPSPLLKLMQRFSERWSLWDAPATRPTFFAVYSHWCMSVVALARGFSIKASRHLLRSSSCLIRARCEVAAEVSANPSRRTRGRELSELWLLLIIYTSAPSRWTFMETA